MGDPFNQLTSPCHWFSICHDHHISPLSYFADNNQTKWWQSKANSPHHDPYPFDHTDKTATVVLYILELLNKLNTSKPLNPFLTKLAHGTMAPWHHLFSYISVGFQISDLQWPIRPAPLEFVPVFLTNSAIVVTPAVYIDGNPYPTAKKPSLEMLT